jgi:uncharacterized protein (TIGR04255 family)
VGKRMAKPPIFYTVAQIVFNPVLDMGDYVPKFHARIRKDFPEFRHEELRKIQLNVADPASTEVMSSSAVPRWSFSNLRQTSGYVLRTDSIAFHTTAYETSAEFSAATARGISLVNDVIGLSYVDRVGFRTLDAIVPEGDQPLGSYLRSEVLGFREFLKGESTHNVTENVTTLSSGQLVSRLVTRSGPVGIPIDLFPISLKFKAQLEGPLGLHAVLDLDHSQQNRFEFDLDEIEQRVRLGKTALTEVFRSTVTPRALASWD